MSTFDKVGEFRRAMYLPIGASPCLLPASQTSYFARFILEELSEYMKAVEEGSLVDAADALVDLVYVTLGCAHAMGLPFDELLDVVHDANMQKKPASIYWRSARGSQYDVIKPAGWVGPESRIAAIISKVQEATNEDI